MKVVACAWSFALILSPLDCEALYHVVDDGGTRKDGLALVLMRNIVSLLPSRSPERASVVCPLERSRSHAVMSGSLQVFLPLVVDVLCF